MDVWIAGELDERDTEIANDAPKRWQFVGVFDTEEKANAACVAKLFFMAPIEMNWSCPRECTEWPGCVYPRYFDEATV